MLYYLVIDSEGNSANHHPLYIFLLRLINRYRLMLAGGVSY